MGLHYFFLCTCLSVILGNLQRPAEAASFSAACVQSGKDSIAARTIAARTFTALKMRMGTNDCHLLEAKLGQVKDLWLNGLGIVDIAPLATFTQLERLDISDNFISDIKPLAKLRRLQYLWIGENEVVDLGPLAEMTHLQLLDAEDNAIVDLTPLARLEQLAALDISHNQVQDIGTLVSLQRLRFVFLSHNRLSHSDQLACLSPRGCPMQALPALSHHYWQQLLNGSFGLSYGLVKCDHNPITMPLWEGGIQLTKDQYELLEFCR